MRSTPRHRAGSPQTPVYMMLQPVRQTARNVTVTTGGLLLFTRRSEYYPSQRRAHLLILTHQSPGEGIPLPRLVGGYFLLCFCTFTDTSFSGVRCPMLSGLSSPAWPERQNGLLFYLKNSNLKQSYKDNLVVEKS